MTARPDTKPRSAWERWVRNAADVAPLEYSLKKLKSEHAELLERLEADGPERERQGRQIAELRDQLQQVAEEVRRNRDPVQQPVPDEGRLPEHQLSATLAALEQRVARGEALEQRVARSEALEQRVARSEALEQRVARGEALDQLAEERWLYHEDQLEQLRGLSPRLLWLEQHRELLSQLPGLLQKVDQHESLLAEIARRQEQQQGLAAVATAAEVPQPDETAWPSTAAGASGGMQPWDAGRERIRVLFVLQDASTWGSWRSVYRAFVEDERFSVLMVLCPFLRGGLAAYEGARELLLREDIPFCEAGFLDLAAARPHVAFLQNPYDYNRPTHLTARELARSGCRVAYIPYGLQTGGGAANLRRQFDLGVHRGAWRIFARSGRQRRMFGRHCSAGNAHVVVTGDPGFDIEEASAGPLAAEIAALAGGRKVILWAPHFEAGEPAGWSAFPLYAEGILRFAQERQDVFLLIRPHPLFFPSMLTHGRWDAGGERAFRERIAASGNMALDESADGHDAVAAASMLLADGGSLLLEFLRTGKPVVYLHDPQGPRLDDEGDVVQGCYCVRGADEIAPLLAGVIDGADPMRDQRLALLREYLDEPDGKAGERIREHVHAALAAGERQVLQAQEYRREGQAGALDYWKGARNSHLADPACCAAMDMALLDWLAEARPSGRMLDIGCADGRYTAIASQYAREIVGMDVSPALVTHARARQDFRPDCRVELHVGDLGESVPSGAFDCVFGLGVTSCVPSDVAFVRLLDRIAHLTVAGGHLVLVDTISLGSAVQHVGADGHVASYRHEGEYLAALAKRGFTPVWERTLSEAAMPLVTRFRVFRRS